MSEDGPDLSQTAEGLLWLLQRMGDEWGPLGVLKTAAKMWPQAQAAMLAEARAEVVRDVAAIPAPGPFDYLADWAQYRSLVIQALARHMPSRKWETSTGAEWGARKLAEVEAALLRAELRGRAEGAAAVVRDVEAVMGDESNFLHMAGNWYVLGREVRAALDPQVPAAVREGGTERSGDVQRPDGPQESAGPSGGRTGPLRRLRCRCGKDAGHTDAPRDGRLCDEPDPTCGHRLGVMRCQLRRGHDGDHEDFSGLNQEKRA